MLTPKQEQFAQCLADGLSQAAAYRKAYPKALTWKDSSVWASASTLAADEKVRLRVDAIRAALAEIQLWTRADSVRVLREVADGEKGGERVAAVKELNVMHGYQAPQKLEHSGGISGIRLVIEGVTPSAS